MSIECTCGRVGEHCPSSNCKGSVSRHPLKQRSMSMSLQLNKDARFYSCRACGTEYGYVNGILYNSECYAPKKIRLQTQVPEPEDEVKAINAAILLLQSKGVTLTVNGMPLIITEKTNEKQIEKDSSPEKHQRVGNGCDMRPNDDNCTESEGIRDRQRVDDVHDEGRSQSVIVEETTTLNLDEIIEIVKEPLKDESNS